MDWDRIEDLMSNQTQRMVFIDSLSFLLGFLETLFKALKECVSVDQCSTLYPRAGPLLTTFVTHPYIGCNEKLVSLVIECLVEYTKYRFDSTVTSSDLIPKSSTWCLQRLRRLSHCSTTSRSLLLPQTVGRKIDNVASSIQEQSKNGNLTVTKMNQLCDMTLLLLKDDTAFKVVEALMDAALVLEQRQRDEKKKHDIVQWDDNNTAAGTCVLSDRFTQYILENMNNESGLYQQQWPVALKTKAWQAIPDLFECEWLDWVGKQLGADIDSTLQRQFFEATIPQHPLLDGLQQCPRLMYASFTLMTRWIFNTELTDWRIVWLWIKLVDWHLTQSGRTDNLQKKIQSWDFPENLTCLLDMMRMDTSSRLSTCHVDECYSGLVSYIYAGSPVTLTHRRNQAWLLSLTSPLYNFWCVGLWIGWCTKDENIWSDKMHHLSQYIAWLVCPSLDERMESYHYGLKGWIQSLKGFDHQDPSTYEILSRFLDHWCILFNGQVQMGVDVLVAMMQHSQNWTTDQCIAMINRFLDGANTLGISAKTCVTMLLLERLAALNDTRMETLISNVHSILP